MRKKRTKQIDHVRYPPFADKLPAPLFFRTEHLPAHGVYPAMRHAWGEFVYSYSGITEVQAGEDLFLAPPHLGLWIPAGTEHTSSNHNETVYCSFYIARKYCQPMPQQLCVVVVTPLVQAMLDFLRDNPADNNLPERQRLLRVLADQLANCQTTGSYVPATSHADLDALLQELRSDPADSRSLDQLAEDFDMSKRTLMRHCQQELGMSLTEWRQRLKIVRALPLLQAGQSVESVAFDLGYGTSSAFIAMFRRLTGTSPKRFVTAKMPHVSEPPTS